MKTLPDLTTGQKSYDNGMDSVVIRRYTGGIPGGRTLDMTDFQDEVIRAGHIVIKDTETGDFKPMPVEGKAYKSLPSKHEYVGVVVASQPKDKPFVAIMNAGEVNDVAMTYPLTEDIRSAIKTAIPTLIFTHD